MSIAPDTVPVRLDDVYQTTSQISLAVTLAMTVAFAVTMSALNRQMQRPIVRALAQLWVVRACLQTWLLTFGIISRTFRWYDWVAAPITGGLLLVLGVAAINLVDQIRREPWGADVLRRRLAVAAIIGLLVGLAGQVLSAAFTPETGLAVSLLIESLFVGATLLIVIVTFRHVINHPKQRRVLRDLLIAAILALLGNGATAAFRFGVMNGSTDPTFGTVVITLNVLSTLALGIASLLAVLEEDRTATQASSEVIRLAGVRAMDAQRFESLGRLASGVAHDFNNLLGVIIGSAEFAAANAGTDPDATRVELQEINSAALRGAGLTRQLLAFARKQPIEPRPISPAASIRELLPLLERVVGKSVTVQTALETDAVVVMDPTHLEQILINLATNARDAMQSGGSLTLGLRSDLLPSPRAVQDGQIEAGPYAVLDVIDTGEGMSDDVLRNVFDPFFTTKAERGGTGLGLATVHSAVRQAQGDVRVESTRGVGTRFEIWLPIFQAPLANGKRQKPADGAALRRDDER